MSRKLFILYKGLNHKVNKALIFEIAKMIIFVIANVNKEKRYMLKQNENTLY